MVLSAVVVLALGGPARAQPADVDPCDIWPSEAIPPNAEPARVSLYWQLCGGDHLGAKTARRMAALHEKLEGEGYAWVEVSVDPAVEGAVGFVDTVDDWPFSLPRKILLPPGLHEIGAIAPGHHGGARQVSIEEHAGPSTVVITLEPVEEEEPETAAVDFAEEGAAAELTTADDLPEAEHDELLDDRFRRGIEARGEPRRSEPRRLAYGVAAGLNLGGFSGDEAPEADGRKGLSLAAIVAYRLRGRFYLQPELTFVQRGADGAPIDYLAVPVRLAFRIELGPLELQLAAGPEVGIAVSDELPSTEPSVFDLGVTAGFGVVVPAGAGSILIDAHTRVGLTPSIDASDARDLSSALRAGYLF